MKSSKVRKKLAVRYLTDVLGRLSGLSQLGCVIRPDVVTLLCIEGFFVLQLHERKHDS